MLLSGIRKLSEEDRVEIDPESSESSESSSELYSSLSSDPPLLFPIAGDDLWPEQVATTVPDEWTIVDETGSIEN